MSKNSEELLFTRVRARRSCLPVDMGHVEMLLVSSCGAELVKFQRRCLSGCQDDTVPDAGWLVDNHLPLDAKRTLSLSGVVSGQTFEGRRWLGMLFEDRFYLGGGSGRGWSCLTGPSGSWLLGGATEVAVFQ